MSTPYRNVRIVDLLGGLTAGYCCKLFTDAGADVILVEEPGGDPLRRWRIGDVPPDGDGPLFRFLRHGQRSATSDVEAWIRTADLVIVGLDGPDPGELRRLRPGLVVLSISPYGRTGPYRDRPATEFTIQADSGGTAMHGRAETEPFHAGGRTGDWFAGVCAGVAAGAALRRARRTGCGELIDLSLAEANHLAMTTFSDLTAALIGPRALEAPARVLETPSVEPTQNGYVGFNTNTRQQWDDFCALIGRPDLREQYASPEARSRDWKAWNAIVHEFTTKHTTEEIVELASAFRIPVAPVCNGETVQRVDHFVERGVFSSDPAGEFVMPRRPWRIDDEPPPEIRPAPALGDAGPPDARAPHLPEAGSNTELPLHGITVLDSTAWWAGPTSTMALAALGAEVIHVEAASRPDGMRMFAGLFAGRDRWWEWSSLFLGANANKLGITLDLSKPRGRELYLDLAARVDLIVENYTPRVFEQFGFTREVLQERNPGLVFVRMPAFGLDGPWRDRPGFAQTMEQVTGLAWVTGFEDDQPRIQRGPCDPNAGMHAAFAVLAALAERDVTGKGCFVESPMVEAALNVAAEQVIEYSAYDSLMQRGGHRGPYAAPQGLYRCREKETWLAVAVASQAQWEALAAELGRPDLEPLDTAERRARHDEIDDLIAAWAEDQVDEVAARQLLDAGVPAAIVRDPRHSGEHPQFAHRNFLETLDHPVVGPQATPSLPFRFASIDVWLRRPAPILGQHNALVLGRLGLGPAELEQLTREGVIGDTLV